MRIVILDNYDSFTYNLYQYLAELDEPPRVIRNDRMTVEELNDLRPDRIVISPGPGRPEDPAYFGVCSRVILELGPRVPLLGVCLGHLGIIHAYGGQIRRATPVMHGKTSEILHSGDLLFRRVPRRFDAMRYHSLVGDPSTLPECLEVIAETSDHTIMGVRHREHSIVGVQFHPESVGTVVGRQILANFVDGA